MLQVNVCPICGGNGGLVKLDVNGDITSYKCQYCGNLFEENKVELYAEQLQSFLDEKKQEEVASLRALLYEEVHKKKYIDSERIVSICQSIREILPDDFMARLFEAVNSDNEDETCNLLCGFDVDEYDYAVDYILDFMLKSLEHAYILPLNNIIENAYKNTDLVKYNKYATLLSKEAEKLEAGIYTPNLPRDVFVCYASKDMPRVMELVNVLENEGISCFVAARNLRHGVGAVQNYNEAIQTAIDYSRIVVFVSSINSRRVSCDTVRVELPYIRKVDIANAPAEYRQNYDMIPPQYKKPRVEYLLNNYSNNSSESPVRNFFMGNEWCLSPESVVTRVVNILTNGWYTPKEVSLASQSGMDSGSSQYIQSNSADIEKARKLLVRAETYLAVGDWKKAQEYADEVLELDPTNSDGALFALLASAHCNNISRLATCAPIEENGQLVEWEDRLTYKQAMYICNSQTKGRIEQALREKKRDLQEQIQKERERQSKIASKNNNYQQTSTNNQQRTPKAEIQPVVKEVADQQTDTNSYSSKKLLICFTVSSISLILLFVLAIILEACGVELGAPICIGIGFFISVVASGAAQREFKKGAGHELHDTFKNPWVYVVLCYLTATLINFVLWILLLRKRRA